MRMITPALSVLSAVEGLEIATPALEPYVVPLSVLILFGLFAVQSHGTARVATFFGPITLVWFVALAAAGAWHVSQNPAVLGAFNPVHGMSFLLGHGMIGLLTLGAVFLVVTGAEALYADLGHFGRGPIRTAWFTVALPALTINYLGQGALLLANPKAIENPFFLLYPDWALLPMIGLATAATVIASQAVISGAYSLTQQAVQLGLLPRFEIRHTSEAQFGQIYMPRVNTLLLLGVLSARCSVQIVERTGFGLRYRRDGDHGGDGDSGFHRHLESLELAAVGGGGADGAIPHHRPRFSRRQPASKCSRAAGYLC